MNTTGAPGIWKGGGGVGKVVRIGGGLRRCPWCARAVERVVVAGDEREEVAVYICRICGRTLERVEKRTKGERP